MKNCKLCLLILACIGFSMGLYAQDAAVKIDGQVVYLKAGNSLPYWLKSGQTIAPSKNVSFLSAMEFNSDSTNHILKYDQVIKIASLSTVPTGKVWKVEAVAYDTIITTTSVGAVMLPSGTAGTSTKGTASSTLPVLYQSPKTYSKAGTWQFVVPPGITSICIEAWGGGGSGGYPGGGSAGYSYGGGGGAGGYGYQCFNVISGTVYTVVVGAGGTVGNSGGTSSVGNLIYSYGGSVAPSGAASGSNLLSYGGTGGSSTATFSVPAVNGDNTDNNWGYVGKGATAYNGGAGGSGTGVAGSAPGGAGSGGTVGPLGGNSYKSPGSGADGQVIIYW